MAYVAIAALLATATIVSAQGNPAPRYRMRDIGTLGGAYTTITSINSNGHAAGWATTPDESSNRAFVYDGTLRPIPPLEGGIDNAAYGINSAGHVVGESWNAVSGLSHAFIFANDVVTDLGTLWGVDDSAAFAINDSGMIVGAASTVQGETHAFRYANGQFKDLGTLGGTFSMAFGVNASGDVVGYSLLEGDLEMHAFRYVDDHMEDINPQSASFSVAVQINDAGQVVGRAKVGTDDHAFLYSQGVTTDLDPFGGGRSEALSINSAGHIVGWSMLPGNLTTSAFLLDGGPPVDLNTRLASNPSGWVLTSARAINDSGHIAVESQIGIETRAFILTPIPPATLELGTAATTYGHPATLSASLSLLGSPLSGKTVRLLVDGVEIGSGLTDGDGLATTPLGPPGRDAGVYPLSAVFDGDESAGEAMDAGTLTVTPATPQIDWHPETIIPYGRLLSSEHLNARATVDGQDVHGQLVYLPERDTRLSVGPRQLTVRFEPHDPLNYIGRFVTAMIEVVKAPTTTFLTSSHNPGLTTQPPIFRADVATDTGVTPTGDVEFFNGPFSLGRAPIVCADQACRATLGGAFLAPAHTAYAITAFYPGDDFTASSVSGLVEQTMRAGAFAIADLGTLGDFALPTALNRSGVVVGYGGTADGQVHGFRSSGTGLFDISTLGGSYSALYAVNRSGLAVGASSTPEDQTHAITDAGGGPFDLGTLGGPYSTAFAVSDAGHVVGEALRADGETHAFLYTTNSGIADLGTAGGRYSIATGVNAAGQVVGTSEDADGVLRAVLFGNPVRDLGTLGGSSSSAFAINGAGHVTGYASTSGDAEMHAVLYRGGSPIDLLTLGGTFSAGIAINASSDVAGDSLTSGDVESHAFLHRNGLTHDLGTFGGMYSTSTGLNDAGQVVGYATNGGDEPRAFMFSANRLVDLNTAIPANTGWVLTFAAAINEDGQIAGEGTLGGQQRAFLLTPIPAATLAVEGAVAVHGTRTSFRAQLTASGSPLSARTIRFAIDGVDAGFALTDDNGDATLDVNLGSRSVGQYPIAAVFGGDDVAGGASAAATLTVIPAAPVINWAPADLTYGTPIGAAQHNATVDVPGQPVYNPPAGTLFDAGQHILTLQFFPTDPVNYTNGFEQRVINVLRAPTLTTLSGSRQTALATQPTTFTARVVTPVERAIGGQVQFRDGGVPLGSAPVLCTGALCTAALSSLSLEPGAHSVTAHFDGSMNFLGSESDPVSLTVKRATYAITDLGTLGGGSSVAVGINDTGQAAGSSQTASAFTHAFLFTNGARIDLGTLGGGSQSFATAIAANGHVVGYGLDGSFEPHAFIYSGGPLVPLQTLGGPDSAANAISPNGLFVTGWSTVQPGGPRHGFLYQGGAPTDLGTRGGIQSEPADVNDAGQIAATVEVAPGVQRAFLYDGETTLDLGAFGGGISRAHALSSRGEVVGESLVNPMEPFAHAFVHRGSSLIDLGTLGGSASRAYDISDGGVIVGEADTAAGTAAFIHDAAGLHNLNELLPPGSGWTLTSARAINNGGQIVGEGTNPLGQHRAFLLTPAPVVRLTAKPAIGQFAGTTTLSATLATHDGPLAGLPVRFTLNGESSDWILTDPKGVATLTGVSLGALSVGAHPRAVGVAFAGNAEYPAATTFGDVTVTFNRAGRLAKVLTFRQQPQDTGLARPIAPPVQVTANDTTGAFVPGMTIRLSAVQGAGVLSGTTTRITNSSGVATFDDLTLNKVGLHALGATASGIGAFTSKTFTVHQAIAAPVVCPSPTFAFPVSSSGAVSPTAVVVGDFNRDAKPDLAIVDETTSQLAILLGNGDGTFSGPMTVSSAAISSPAAIRKADVNNDGKLDLIVANGVQDAGIAVLLGDGSGGFSSMTSVAIPGVLPTDLHIADINRDGRIDAVVGTTASSFWVLPGNTKGGFDAGTQVPTIAAASSLATADFNEDGVVDIISAAASAGAPTALEVHLGTKTGTFAAPLTVPVGPSPRLRVVTDINGDGHSDLGITVGQPTGFSLLYGDGTGHFGPPVEILEPDAQPGAAESGDINGDGFADLAVVLASTRALLVMLGDGAGDLLSLGFFISPRALGPVVVRDVTGDGKADLIATGPEVVAVYRNNCSELQVDLRLTLTPQSPAALVGSAFRFNVSVTNAGQSPATDVHLASLLVPGASFQAVTTSQGTCSQATGDTTCSLGTIPPAGAATIDVDALATAVGPLYAAATVAGAEADPDSENNSAFETVTVVLAPELLTVRTTADAGPDSLRDVIQRANMVMPGVPVTIAFDIPEDGVQTISPLASLPEVIKDSVVIDGTTQHGFGGLPLIELNGALAGPQAVGLQLTGGNSTLRGLVINGFAGTGVLVNSDRNVVGGNFIGTNAAGALALANGIGIQIGGASDNRIGGPTAAERNVVSGNNIGIALFGGALANVVQGNHIGVDAAGAARLPNDVGVIGGAGSGNNLIGGVAPGEGNVISGNQWTGIQIGDAPGYRIQGNLIGLDATGLNALGNFHGVLVDGALSMNTLIGGTVAGARNVISANTLNSIRIDAPVGSAVRTLVQGNLIGTDTTGARALGNGAPVVVSSPNTTIGGNEPGASNVIAATDSAGILANGPEAGGLVVRNNLIGTDVTGTIDLGNRNDGVQINNVAGATIDRNVISGNGDRALDLFANGISVNGASSAVRITGNTLGLDASGGLTLENFGHGVSLNGGEATTIGGTSATDRNLISGNGFTGVSLSSSTTGNVIAGNFIGTDASGSRALPNGNGGIDLSGSSNNTIGLPGAGNVISGHLNSSAITMFTDDPQPPAVPRVPTGNRVLGNLIGTTADGMSPLGNGSTGVWINGDGNVVGGAATGERNVIAASRFAAVSIRGNNNVLVGNYLGTNATGTAGMPNNGAVFIDGGSTGNVIGGLAQGLGNLISGNIASAVNIQPTAPGNSVLGNYIGTNAAGTAALSNDNGLFIESSGNVVRNNTVSGNWGTAITLWGVAAVNNVVAGNRIGTGADGSSGVGNSGSGISVNADNNTIGGTIPEDRNVISANLFSGVDLRGTANVVSGNYIGTNASGTAALPNRGSGVSVDDLSSGNTIGGLVPGAANLISGNLGNGISVTSSANNTSIIGNDIGTNAPGTAAIANNGGIWVGSSGNAIRGNVISGNSGAGVRISGPTAVNNVVAGNLVGTSPDGRSAVSNSGAGVAIDGSTNIVGGTAASDRNVIAGNDGSGIEIRGSGNTVAGNYIGTDVTGTHAVPNLGGVSIYDFMSDANTIGGLLPGSRNVISGNAGAGVSLNGRANVVSGNFIGTDESGTRAVGNDTGITVNEPDNRIEHNLISGNRGDGIDLIGGASRTIVTANGIGTDASGIAAVANEMAGIFISASNNTIGGETADGNRIAHNRTGVLVSFGSGNAILSNSIDSNDGPGIRLLFDSNGSQPAPVVTSVISEEGSTTISGTLQAAGAGDFVVQLFGSPVCDPSGFGEGAMLLNLDQTVAVTNAAGTAQFVVAVAGLPPGSVVTATATSLENNTSAFSGCKNVP